MDSEPPPGSLVFPVLLLTGQNLAGYAGAPTSATPRDAPLLIPALRHEPAQLESGLRISIQTNLLRPQVRSIQGPRPAVRRFHQPAGSGSSSGAAAVGRYARTT